LSTFRCRNNKIKKIIATNHKHLHCIQCENNELEEVKTFGALNLLYLYGKGNPNLQVYLPMLPSADMYYSYDKTAKVYYPWDFK